jgi:cell division protein FtsI (penicillin-binding protein 3)
VLLVALLIALGAITVRLGQLQGVSAAYVRRGLEQRQSTIAVTGERGSILDRNGHDLAISVPQWSVWANPWLIPDGQAVAAAIAPILAKPQDELAQKLVPKKTGRQKVEFVYIARRVDDETWKRIEELHLPGLGALPESKRFYPAGDLAASVIGFVGADNNGLEGLEHVADKLLSGEHGEYIVERDPAGNRLPGGPRRITPTRRGTDVVLTLDQSIQFETERVTIDAVTQHNARGGVAIVADIKSGDVLAMVNVNGNPGQPAKLADRFHNAALQDVYEPGSTNKVITVAAGLEAGLITPITHYLVPDKMKVAGRVFSDHESHSPTDWTVSDILTNSSNVGTIMIGQQVGKNALDNMMRAFGYGAPTGVGTTEESGILLPTNKWSATTIATVPIGNGLAVTAMQMLDVYMTIASGGIWHEPRLIQATIDSKGDRHERKPGLTRPVISSHNAQLLNEMLRNVVRSGTGTQAAIPGYTVAGKTGTARKAEPGKGYSGGHYVASFVGFAPAEQPRLVAIVVLDDPKPIFGGTVAAPAFAKIMQYALRAMRVPPPPQAPPAAGPTGHGKAGVELDGPAHTADDGSDAPSSTGPAPSTPPPGH